MIETPIESFKIDEGTDAYGVNTQLIFQGDELVKKRTFDAAPLIAHAEQSRIQTASDRWGDGRKVGVIPMAIWSDIQEKYKSAEERKQKVLEWLRDNPKLVTFDKFLL